jgi:hypothetical protein
MNTDDTNDTFLTEFRERPRPEFADALYARIERAPAPRAERPRSRWRPAFAAAAALATFVALFSMPAVRAAAQDFLDMFRVKRFVAVPVDPSRIDQLRARKLGVDTLLADNVEETTPRSEPREVASVADASAAANLPLLVPTYVFNVKDAPKISVAAEHAARITADAGRLRGLLDALGISDVEVPEALDGAKISLRVPAAVAMRYERDGATVATFIQARSPEVGLPDGVDVATLGEIGLRIAGLSADEAHDFARKVDWNGTLLVPVPADAASFRETDVRGTTGLLVESDNRRTGGDSQRTVLLWSENGTVYAIVSQMHPVDVLEMANSLRDA